jgi:hypothetical protein
MNTKSANTKELLPEDAQPKPKNEPARLAEIEDFLIFFLAKQWRINPLRISLARTYVGYSETYIHLEFRVFCEGVPPRIVIYQEYPQTKHFKIESFEIKG